ncbi:hypothetical protein EYC80_004606 [Monilinia laxa]|uniref:Uncharacterized protein n=1 Tax=Monilinia laxa TaxID=61186 RepID=A0A5N6KHM3_MONLA|nr:hypothetical protein EYC80_004606 [Monilinia laxa]
MEKNGPTEVIRGKIPEDQITSWLEQRDAFVNTNQEISRTGALRLLFTNRALNSDKKAVGMTFNDATLQIIISRLQLPAAFAQMLAPDQIEPPRFSHSTLFDTHGNHLGMAVAIHFHRWRLESITLGISYNQNTKFSPNLCLTLTALSLTAPTRDSEALNLQSESTITITILLHLRPTLHPINRRSPISPLSLARLMGSPHV